MYFLINFVFRQVEMRYLLQADTALLIFTAIGIGKLIDLLIQVKKRYS